ncbi:hypothetical protein ACHHYP_06897 [Achlya hypogyna]|uniref:K Homology domain-containing protein n=1 Tax=Achlya hypogyna TaxID=1202772 RepID=A0A1V9ZN22_ACHHY|nr:hypothetical protein ACHHYP_06897 [Achlya hypogyna]
MSGKGGKGKTAAAAPAAKTATDKAAKAAAKPAAAPATKTEAKPAKGAKAAQTPAATPAPKAAPVVPVTQELVAERKTVLANIATRKTTMLADAKAAEEELTKLLKHPKARVQGTVAQLEEEAKKLEFKRTTTSMSLNDEKRLLKELETIKVRKAQVTEYEEFQATVQTLKDKKNELFDTLRATEAYEKTLTADVRKMTLALSLHTSLDAFVTVEISVPKDKMGMVVGKNYAKLRQFEETYHVLLEVENGAQKVKVTSVPKQIALVEAAINNIALATTHSLAVHPDTLKLLMIQKGHHLKALETQFDIKIDVQRAENTISFQAAPDRAAQLETTLKALNTNKATIDLPTDVIPKLIGKKGEVISKIMEDTAALLDIDRVTNCVHIVGPAESVAAARAAVDAIIHDQAATSVQVRANDPAFFGQWDAAKFPAFVEYLMADKAVKLKALRKDALDCRLQVVKNKNRFDAEGNRHQIEALKTALQAAVEAFVANVTTMDVDESCLSLIIGKKGSKIKAIEEASGARVDIQGHTVYLLGEPEQVEKAAALIDDIIARNQRSVVYTSSVLTSVLLNNKRAKLNEIEKASGCSVQLPPAPAGGGKGQPRTKASTIAITLTGTTSAIQAASEALEALNEEHKAVYLPLDSDEVATVIGKKGETITRLEKDSGCRLRVLDDADGDGRELELMGTAEQVATATAAVDALLKTSARHLLTLDEFSVACLIGKKGERIKEVRAAHPNVTLDTFPKSQVVRIKGTTKADVEACVAGILELLQTSTVVETIASPAGSSARFATLLAEPTVALHLAELEGAGGVKATVLENGHVKVRGSPLGVGKIKAFLTMLGDDATHCVVVVPLLAAAHATSLRGKTPEGLHENVLQVVKQTKTVIRIKADKSSPSGFVVSIEGSSMAKVLDAKLRVESLVQFFFPTHVKVLGGVAPSALPRLFQTVHQLASYHVSLSLAAKDAIKIVTDSEAHTKAVHKKLQDTLKAHLQEYHEIAVPSYIVPLLVGKSGETIKKLEAKSHASLTLATADDDALAARALTIHSRDEANVKAAVRLVTDLIRSYEAECKSVAVPATLLDAALALKRQNPPGVSFAVKEKTAAGAIVQVHASSADERTAAVEQLTQFVASTTAAHIALPNADVVGSLIGKGGANIKALQAAHPGLQVDIQRADKAGGQSRVVLLGDKAAVSAAATWVQEKLATASAYHEEKRQPKVADKTPEAPEEAPEPPTKTGRHVPVGAPVALDKNQRRRLRKRAEKEAAEAAKPTGVLSPRAHYGPKSDFASQYFPPGSRM